MPVWTNEGGFFLRVNRQYFVCVLVKWKILRFIAKFVSERENTWINRSLACFWSWVLSARSAFASEDKAEETVYNSQASVDFRSGYYYSHDFRSGYYYSQLGQFRKLSFLSLHPLPDPPPLHHVPGQFPSVFEQSARFRSSYLERRQGRNRAVRRRVLQPYHLGGPGPKASWVGGWGGRESQAKSCLDKRKEGYLYCLEAREPWPRNSTWTTLCASVS